MAAALRQKIRLQAVGWGRKGFFYRRDPRKACVQNEFGSGFDFFRVPLPALAVRHRECQGRFRHIVNLISQIGSVARGGLAALFGADAGHDDSANPMLRKPDVKSAADKGTVTAFSEYRIRRERQIPQRCNVPRFEREGTGVLDVKNLDHWDFAGLGSGDERSQAVEESRHVGVAPVRTMTERFLYVNDKKRSSSGHATFPGSATSMAIPANAGKTWNGP